MDKLVSITELSKILNKDDLSPELTLNHTIRYWESQFKQIKPLKINNRRHYTSKQVEIFKMIKFLLKNKGMTISGVKELLNLKINKLDDLNNHSLKADYYKKTFKKKAKSILNKIERIKIYGKKNSS